MSCPPRHDPETSLQRVLEATEALEATLAPLDVEAFRRALAERTCAIDLLVAGTDPTEGPAASDAVRDLAAAAAQADLRVRARATQALADLRGQLRSLSAGSNGLAGYRPATSNLPRFADRKG